MDKVIYITGASSKIGECLRIKFFNSKYKVILLSRNKLKLNNNETYVKYQLGDCIDPLDGDYKHIIFHLAHDYYDRKKDNNLNFQGLKNIVKSFKNISQKKIVFISTPDCLNKNSTTYTLQKKMSESLLNIKKDLIVRPSLLYSDNGTTNIFKKLPKFGVPIPINKNKIAPMEVEKFSSELFDCFINNSSIGVVLFCGKESMSLEDFLKKYYKINTFHVHNYFWFTLIFLFKLSRSSKLFYLSERILGFIYLRDINDLQKDIINKRYV
jgi:dTDP-4-dehydrorhamnose reductase